MSEESTENLDAKRTFEERVLAEFAALNGRMAGVETRLTTVEERLTSLEEKMDARMRETRPIWELILSRLEIIDARFDVVAKELLDMRAETVLLKKRFPPAA